MDVVNHRDPVGGMIIIIIIISDFVIPGVSRDAKAVDATAALSALWDQHSSLMSDLYSGRHGRCGGTEATWYRRRNDCFQGGATTAPMTRNKAHRGSHFRYSP
ncbi:hypothetical protein [Rhizobium sp. Leaf383]|uniref:hypothetical protein n=1 Tax=Rhizobium sp. Leaf383 TaxID=1736357 RepID=UPI0012E9228C|nr:hypothetical protein [Rhizobium sp. Leaf383]